METDYKNTFIYGLIERGNQNIKYVGKSNNPKRRMQQHICDSLKRKTPKDYWIQSIIKKGGKIDLIILEEIDYRLWPEREVYWINVYKKQIKNCSEGGCGGRPIKYLASYENVKKWIKENIPEINSQIKWFKNIKNLPEFISPYPSDTYAHRGWISWGDFLGTNKICDNLKSKLFISYNEAKIHISLLKIKNRKDWKKFINSKEFPIFLPRNPENSYKNKGWISWYDFLGNKKIEYPEYNEALKISKNLKINSSNDWRSVAKENSENVKNLPYSPDKVYKNCGWTNWFDWLGKNKKES